MQALRYFETALDRDPNSAEAMIQLAWWHWWNATESRRREPGVWDAMEDYIRRVGASRPAGPIGRAMDEIPDPAGEPLAAYRRVAERLERDLARLATSLAGER